jgi:curved DNA-binding protein
MKYKDYYAILGVARGASDEEIKKAYRRLARKFHPDVSKEKDAKERFQEVSEAYETLKDKEKRAAYDSLGSGFRPGQDFRPPPDWQQRFADDGGINFSDADLGGIDLSDLFASLGAGRRGGPGGGFGSRGDMQFPGEDYEFKVELSIEDAMRGTELELEMPVRELTPQGRIQRSTRKVRARIPAGATAGQKLRLRGQGGAGINGGPAGDLYLRIELRPHPLYRADGHDLYIDLPVTPWEAALGAEVEVPTLSGRVSMKVPAGSRSGQRLRLSGKGLPRPGGGSGDLYAVLGIVVPPTLGEREKALYAELRDASNFNPRSAHAKEAS